MKIVTISSLFPNKKEPNKGIFTLKILEKLQDDEIVAIAPIPWFPFVKKNRIRGVPFKEEIKGITIYHPKFFSIPFFLKSLDAFLFYRSLKRFEDIIKRSDVIYSSYGYPDGLGSYYLARKFRKPFFITLHRGDIINWGKKRFLRKKLRNMVKNASKVFVVSETMRRLIRGHKKNKNIIVIPNGVDTNLFKPIDKKKSRKKLDIDNDSRVFLTIGNAMKRKGYFELARSFDELETKNKLLLIIGNHDKKELSEFKNMIKKLKSKDKIILVGEVANEKIKDYYSAADAYCLVSYSEGWPCSVMESLACGRPCIVTKESAGEFITKDLGIITDYDNLTENLEKALRKKWDKRKILKFAQENSWDKCAGKVYGLFQASLRNHKIYK
ncbi:glycosyltransferase [Candidatus Woesearchaeota archaeon]|nr:glycosyltransferase [Candidatus Woesearchaeota archaeon]